MKKNYWSLILEPDWVQAALWSKTGDDLEIVSSSKSASYESHDLIEVVDSCLTDAISDFPDEEKEPSETVFGVPSFWVKDGSIDKEHLEKIRNICTKLSLSPTGFVVLSEAAAHSVKIREGSPLTGVVVNLSKNFVSVSVFKLGNLVGTVNVGRSVSVFEDIVEGLTRFEMTEPLPTRFILLGGDSQDLEDRNQELIKSDWTDFGDKNLRFLHTPQFEILDKDQKAIAVSIAGASEMGNVASVEYAGIDLSESKSEPTDDDNNIAVASDISAEDIGFVIDQDIDDVANEKEDDDEPEDVVKKPELKTEKIKINKFRKFNKLKASMIGFLLILFVAFGSAIAAWWYLPKAEVVIYVSPKRLEAKEAITLDENEANVSPDDMVFLATNVSIEVSESKDRKTTGAITVGDKSSGRVTIRNGTSNAVQLDVGDTIIGPNDLEFVVIESASVSAAISPTQPGEATVNAEAGDIGAEYNIAKDETLTVSGFSSSEVDAVVNEAFSGGSSKEIIAISQNDLDVLESELLSELKRKGIAKLESQVSDGRFIPESVETTVVSADYSGSVGDESSSVSLTLTVEMSGIAILDETVENLAQKLLADQVPDGFSLRTEQVDADFELVEEVDTGLYDFDVTLSANLLPEVKIDDIKSNIMGKYPPQAEEYLSSIQGFSKAEVSLNPRFPGRLGVIPRVSKNISVEIQAER